MRLIDKEEFILSDYNTAKVLNIFFSNIASNLNIAEYSNNKHLAHNTTHPVLKCVLKYRNHSSVLGIGKFYNKHPRLPSSFSKINREEILRKILNLRTSKAFHHTDIKTKIVKDSGYICWRPSYKFKSFCRKIRFFILLKNWKYNTCISKRWQKF